MNKKSTVLITGGTGSFGKEMTKRLLSNKVKEVRIFSRDEKKQEDLNHIYLRGAVNLRSRGSSPAT